MSQPTNLNSQCLFLSGRWHQILIRKLVVYGSETLFQFQSRMHIFERIKHLLRGNGNLFSLVRIINHLCLRLLKLLQEAIYNLINVIGDNVAFILKSNLVVFFVFQHIGVLQNFVDFFQSFGVRLL